MRVIVLIFFLLAGMFTGAAKADCKVPGCDSLPGKILIINSFDANAMKARKNKKELFGELADSLKQLLYKGVQRELLTGAEIYDPLFSETIPDSVVIDLLDKNQSTNAIIIRKIDIHFNQTGVEVTGTKGDKTRTASYDICAFITYRSFGRDIKPDESETRYCEYFSDRTVVSGLLAGGPDIVAKRKHAFRIMAKNVQQYLNGIFYLLNKE